MSVQVKAFSEYYTHIKFRKSMMATANIPLKILYYVSSIETIFCFNTL